MKFRRRLVEGLNRVLLCGVVCIAACGGGDDSSGAGNSGSKDKTPPTFTGLNKATVNDDGSVDLSWDQASDNDSSPQAISYIVYVGTQMGGEDFSKPFAVTPSGATGATLSNVVAGEDHFWVVRAVDQAGNQDQNMVEKAASPPDTAAPRFAGATTVTAQSSHSALVSWRIATDNASSSSGIKYAIFVADTPEIADKPGAGMFDFSKPTQTAKAGETSALLDGYDPLSTHYVVVRAVDGAGNQDQNKHVLHFTTPEGVAPTFAGLKQINATSDGMKLYWLPASDNLTDVANIVYNIYFDTDAKFSAANPGKPKYVSPQGEVTFVVPNLINQQRYSFMVRAQDTAANEDGNTVVLSARALNGVDTTAPSFDGGSVTVTGDSPSSLLVSWNPGTDLVTDAAHLTYSLYLSSTSDPIPDGTPPTLIAAPGATSMIIAGLPTQATRYVTVRCSDEAGNTLPNSISKSGTTLGGNPADLKAPTLAGSPTFTTEPALPTAVHVSWSAATDETSTAAKIRYLVCASQTQSDCLGANFVNHVYAATDPGTTNVDLSGLLSRTHYYVFVRGEDEAGNISATDNGDSVTTPTSYSLDVGPIIFDKCNGCHDFSVLTMRSVAGGFVDTRLPPPANPALAGGLALVEPGNPRDSMIYRRINPLGDPITPFSPAVTDLYRGPQEPQNAQKIFVGPLSGAQDGAIRDWIEQGANAN
jgi:hypothetical protein